MHWHVKDPAVFLHEAIALHCCALRRHSSTSLKSMSTKAVGKQLWYQKRKEEKETKFAEVSPFHLEGKSPLDVRREHLDSPAVQVFSTLRPLGKYKIIGFITSFRGKVRLSLPCRRFIPRSHFFSFSKIVPNLLLFLKRLYFSILFLPLFCCSAPWLPLLLTCFPSFSLVPTPNRPCQSKL